VEKERSERLCHVVPRAIGAPSGGESNIAQGHADVTVMFADIVGFTKMTEELAPVETVKILNDVFSMFDEIADKYGVEKIKTIGDAYMAAAGVETGAQVHYADAVANMALEMLGRVHEYRQRSGENIELRVGIGTGPVVAGVIGKKKFILRHVGGTVTWPAQAGDAFTGSFRLDSPHTAAAHSLQVSTAARVEIGQGAHAGVPL